MVTLSEEARKLMEEEYNKDIKIVKEEYFPKNSLIEIKHALEFAINQIEADPVDSFLEGINYQKKRR